MNRRAFVLALAAATAPAAAVLAHEGHDHKLVGHLAEAGPDTIVVKAVKGGAVSSVKLTPATKITKGRMKMAATDLKVGDRVVVNVGNGTPPLVAKAVQIGTAATTR
ncbi:MAG: hypothetical protein AB7O28_04020 [Vicinamibacterales bacterium]